MIVSLRAPRSTVELAPISTSSWMMTRPICGTLRCPRRAHGEAEAVLADAHARMDDHPVADEGVGDGRQRADVAVAADGDAIADDRAGGDARAAADAGLGADDGAGLDDDALLQLGGRVDAIAGRPPGAPCEWCESG